MIVGAEPLHYRDQAVVAKLDEFADAAPCGLCVGLGSDPGRERLCKRRPFDARPGKAEGRPELLEKMLHPRFPAREAVEEEGAHDAPAKTGAVGDRLIDLPGGGDPVVDEVEGLAPDRFEEAVRDECVDLRVEHEGMHADRSVEVGGVFLRFRGRGVSADYLDEGQQVDGDEGVADEDSLPRRAVRLEAAREEARGRGGDDRVGASGPARASEEGALHLLALGRALLNEGRPLDRFLDARHDLDPAGGNGRREGEPGVGAGRVLERLVDPVPGARVGIVDPDVDAVHREPRRPSGPGDARPEEGDSPDFAHPAALKLDARKLTLRSPARPAASRLAGRVTVHARSAHEGAHHIGHHEPSEALASSPRGGRRRAEGRAGWGRRAVGGGLRSGAQSRSSGSAR